MENHIASIITELGEDVDREGLKDTPKRAAEALRFLTSGYHQDIDKLINGALFTTDSCSMVLVKDIELYSLCEHHLLPFIGKCHVAYLPDKKVVGLSKIARIVNLFACRFQIQEKLTKQIADCVLQVTHAKGVAVVVEAKHMCMMMRGVQKQNSIMETSVMLGVFQEDINLRAEMLSQIRS